MVKNTEPRLNRMRARILAHAETLFLGKGFVSTSMDEVAAAAAVSKQTVYAHFKSKEALFIDVVEAMTGTAVTDHQLRVGEPAEDVPAATFLNDFAARQLEIVMTPRLMQLRRLVIGEAARFPELGRTLHRRGPGRSIERLASVLERYAARGELAVADPWAAASAFNWLVMGAATNDAMLLGDESIPPIEALRAHAAESVRIFLAAFGPGCAAEPALNAPRKP